MIDETTLGRLHGTDVVDRDGSKIGSVEEIFLDDATNRPEWIAVKTGWFGSHISLVPLRDAEMRTDADAIAVPFSKDTVKDAPHHDVDQHLSREEERDLYAHYDLDYDTYAETAVVEPVAPAPTRERVVTEPKTTTARAPKTASDDDAMTVSEERMKVASEGSDRKARLRKYVVTEHVNQTVPVRKEKVKLEHEPITEANRDKALSGAEITEAEHEVTLHEERPRVEKETVPVERVKLSKETETGEKHIEGDVRKERVATEGVYPDEKKVRTEERTRR